MIKKLLKKLIVLVVLITSTTDVIVAQNNAAYQAQYTNPAIQRILRLDKTVRDKGAIVGTLTAQDLTRLPIGIMDPSGKVVICVDSAKFTPIGATFNAYVALQLPGMKEKMCFRAVNIPMGPSGITSSNAPALTLVSTHVLQMGDKVDLVIPGTGGNNIQWDCNGFKEVNIEGKFVFKDGVFQVDKVEAPNDSSVTATVQFQHITNINNMMANVSITPFKIRGMEDFAFKVTDATVDMSDHNNPNNFQFPAVYQNEFGANINLWRGFFLRNITVRLPFNKNNGYASVSASNMLIDQNGVSGLFAGNNLIDITQGNANGWPISVDTLRIELLRNKLTGGAIVGGMKIPFLGNDSLGYIASVSQWNDETQYLFQLSLREDKVFNTPLGTSVTLRSGSYVQIEKYGDTLEPTAFLQGKMGTSDTATAKFKGLKFENISLSTHAPYVHSGTFSLTDSLTSPSLAGFNVCLSNVGFSVASGRASLSFNAALNFMGQQDQGFGVQGGFTFKARFENETTPVKNLKWVYDGMVLNNVALNVNTGSFKLSGLLEIYRNDATYGNGFRGAIAMKILEGKMDLQATAQAYFGNKNGMKYFQVSAYLSSNNFSVPVVPSVIYLNGFMGGISWHMRKQNAAMFTLPVMLDSTTKQPMTDASSWAKQQYIPDANSGLGIMVGVNFKGPDAKLISGSVALEVGLNANWGLNFVELKGLVSMFKDMSTIAPQKVVAKDISSDAIFRGEICMLYDVPNKTFHANIAAYLNVKDKIVGAGPNHKVGELVIHAAPGSWYIYVGRPSSPLGIKLTELATLQAYFMVGSTLDKFPTPPNEVLQNIAYTPMINATQLNEGGGVAFGARFNSSFGFGMEADSKSWVYGGFSVGAGADVMLSTSGNYTCEGEAVGFDGWWARGQAYVYIQGAVGIRVKVFKKVRKFDIASLSAGLLLEAKIPKPSWFRGFGYFQFNVLGGLVKGKASFKVQLGKECQVVSNPNDDREIETKIVSGNYPTNGQTNVELYGLQAITTNIPVNSGFQQMDEDGTPRDFACIVESFKLYKNTEEIPSQIIFEDGKKRTLLKPRYNLEPGTTYKVAARFAYKKMLNNASVWTTVQNPDGSLAEETVNYTFVTGPPSSVIRMHNIEYAYPFSDMQNFYKNQYADGGYIKVDPSVNFTEVFNPGTETNGVPAYEYKVKIKGVSPGSTQNFLMPFTVQNQSRTLKFGIPTDLTSDKVYKLSLVRIANATANNNQVDSAIINNQNNNTDSSKQSYYSDTTINNVLNGPIVQKETEMFSYHFRVSKYNTFGEKVQSMSTTYENVQDIAVGNVLMIGSKKNNSGEIFDDFELKPLSTVPLTIDGEPIVVSGSSNYASNFPLIKVRADSSNSWFLNDIMPTTYPNYVAGESATYIDTVTSIASGLANFLPPGGCTNINGSYTGIKPLDKVTIENIFTNYPHNDAYERLRQAGSANTSNVKLIIKYNVPYFASLDYREMYYAGLCIWARTITSLRTPAYTTMVSSGGVFPQIKTGTYKINLTYTLPGNIQTSNAKMEIQY
jgi:hypothetical protein